MKTHLTITTIVLALLAGLPARASIKITVDHNDNEHAGPEFKFKNVPSPCTNNAATVARFIVVSGERDENGGEITVLQGAKLPSEEDEPSANFFFDAGTPGGRFQVDLVRTISIKQVNTYSWHPNTRGPQIYKLYASDGVVDGFDPKPRQGVDPEKHGWKLIAVVNTKPKNGDGGGQYGVSIADSDGAVGKYRYLLFDVSRTEEDDDFGNTFYSAIDVIEQK
jgi:hypothetical protein